MGWQPRQAPPPPPLTQPTSFTAHVETTPSGAFASRAGLFPDVSPLMPHGHETYAYESSGQQVCHTPVSEVAQSEIDHKSEILKPHDTRSASNTKA